MYVIISLSTVKYLPTWMPGAGFKQHAMKTREAVQRMFDVPYDIVKTQHVNNPFLVHITKLTVLV